MGAHPWAQWNISTVIKYFAGLGPQSLFKKKKKSLLGFFLPFFYWTSQSRTWIVCWSYPFRKPDRTPGSSIASRTETHPVTESALNLSPGPGRGSEQSRARGREQSRALPPRLGRSLLRRGTHPAHGAGAASRSISCDAAHGPGLKFGPAEVKGPFSPLTFQPTRLRLAPNRACHSGTYLELKQSISGSPKWHGLNQRVSTTWWKSSIQQTRGEPTRVRSNLFTKTGNKSKS